MSTRKRYETESDRKNERIVRELIKEHHDNCILNKPTNAHYSMVDYFAFDPFKCIGLFEIKCRHFNWGKFPTITFSSGKWAEGLKFSQSMCVPFYIVISCFDGTYQYKQNIEDVSSGKIVCEWGGRTSATRDSGDIEPVMMIPIELFEKISDESAFNSQEESTNTSDEVNQLDG